MRLLKDTYTKHEGNMHQPLRPTTRKFTVEHTQIWVNRGKTFGAKIDGGGGGNGQCRKLGHGPTFIPTLSNNGHASSPPARPANLGLLENMHPVVVQRHIMLGFFAWLPSALLLADRNWFHCCCCCWPYVKRDHCTALWAVQHPSMTPTGCSPYVWLRSFYTVMFLHAT